MKRFGIFAALLFLLGILPAQAANIHMRYFESVDVILDDEVFQLYSFGALEAETVTIVVYGLEEGLQPNVSVFDVAGVTLAEDLNADGDDVSGIQFEAPENGLYTFLVSQKTEVGGLVRVMLFVGEPLPSDFSMLDTIDPFLPSRAYFVAGDAENPVKMTVVVQDDVDPNTPRPQVFASRGTEVSPPPLEERVTAIEQFTWENDRGDIFYTLNVRAIPEPMNVSQKMTGQLSYMAQSLGVATIRVDTGDGLLDGLDPAFLERPQCMATVRSGGNTLLGPSDDYIDGNGVSLNQEVELLGENGDFYLIVDLESPTGGSWIPKADLELITPLDDPFCQRVQSVDAPPLTPENSRVDNPPANNNSAGSGGNTAFGGLAPSDLSFSPIPSDEEKRNGNFIVNPPPAPPGTTAVLDDQGNVVFLVPSSGVGFDCNIYHELVINWSDLQPSDSIAYSGDLSGSFPVGSSNGSYIIGSGIAYLPYNITVTTTSGISKSLGTICPA